MKRRTLILISIFLIISLIVCSAATKDQFTNFGDGNAICDVCRLVYTQAAGDPGNGIPPGTSFDDLPDDWVCPSCGCSHNEFKIIHDHGDKSTVKKIYQETDQLKTDLLTKE